MTIKELYDWAVENGVEDFDYKCDYGEGITEPDPPTIEKNFVVL